MSFITQNIRILRKLKGLTQEQLAAKVGIKRSLVGAYEEGRAEPNIANILKFSEVLGVTVDDLISTDFSAGQKEESGRDATGKNLRILSITLDKEDKELIHLVPYKAAAGYLNGYSDPEYLADLPVFNVPSFNNGSYRAFEISGDSMLPIVSGSIIIARYVENWEQIKDNTRCIVITNTEGLVFKRIFKNFSADRSFTLVSDNPVYDPYSISLREVVEIWEAKGYFSTVFPEPEISTIAANIEIPDLKKARQNLK